MQLCSCTLRRGPGEGGGYSIKFYTGRLPPGVKPLPFNILIFTPVSPPFLDLRPFLSGFAVALGELLKALSFRVLRVAIFANI